MPHAAASKTDHRDAGVFLMLFIVFTFQCLKKTKFMYRATGSSHCQGEAQLCCHPPP